MDERLYVMLLDEFEMEYVDEMCNVEYEEIVGGWEYDESEDEWVWVRWE